MRSCTLRALATLVAVPLLGCSISASSWSLSKSVRSSSHSSDSSSSSSPGAAERAYREDVTDYTRAFAKSRRGDFAGFQADLAHLAEEHGITNWEANPATYTAIGEGLGQAQVSDAELMAYKRNLSGDDAQKADLIQKGYDSAR
jgi:hypothetical protein